MGAFSSASEPRRDSFDLIFNQRSLTLKGMHIPRSSLLWCAILSMSISGSLALAEEGGEELPPPPETFDMPATSDEASAGGGAELPPPPEVLAPEPVLSAEAPAESPTEVPVDEDFPPLPPESAASTESSPEMMEAETTPPPLMPSSTQFSSNRELMDLGVEDRVKVKELVLWLYFGGSYGSVAAKGVTTSTTTTTQGDPGGIGYNAGLGGMLSENLQMALDFVGTPRTTTTTVDSAMFGIGPRFGFLSVMALFGVQRGENIINNSGKNDLMAYGIKGGLDIILGHSKDSRVSYGIAPEVYYITPQAASGGYNQLGATVAFRIYGYENAF